MRKIVKEVTVLEKKLNEKKNSTLKAEILLKYLGLTKSQKIHGYEYLRDALVLCIEDETRIRKIQKLVYAQLGQKYDKNYRSMGFVIKNVKEKIFEDDNASHENLMRKIFIFGSSALIEGSDMTNLKFIASLRNYLDEVTLYQLKENDLMMMNIDSKSEILILEELLKERRISRKRKIYIILKFLGMNQGNLGYDYLREALFLCMEDRAYLKRTSKRLYPKLARMYCVPKKYIQKLIGYEIKNFINSTSYSELLKTIGLKIFGDFTQLNSEEFMQKIIDYIDYMDCLECAS